VKKDIEFAKKVGARIRNLRKQRNLTQEKLSELSGIDSKHIQLMEGSNPSNPRVDTILNLCNAFGIGLQDFFSDKFLLSHANEINATEKKASYLVKAKSGTPSSLSQGKTILENNSWKISFHKQPRIRGQMRIDPKRKKCRFENLEPDEKHSLWSILEDAIAYLNREYNPDGFNVGFDLGESFGAESDFVLHIIPRYKGDPESRLGGITSILPEKFQIR
jgi:transcriptional regulator with XRE-family HTH domain